MKGIPSLKARAELIPKVLQCIKNNLGDYRRMEHCILSLWREVSYRTKAPSKKNSLRAVFGPSLRHLRLIMGEGDKIKLTAKGEELLEVYQKEGESVFKKAFAKHLLKLDKEEWMGLIIELQNFKRLSSEQELLRYLRNKYPNLEISADRLTKLLLQYSYVGLVKKEKGTIQLRGLLLNNLMKGLDVRPSEQAFVQALFKAYEKLRVGSPGSSYIAIPDVREEVCKETKIWPSDFDKYLKKIPKETRRYMIHLTSPMLRKPGGIKLGEKYLYYLAIYKK
jgi:hypothetical protein